MRDNLGNQRSETKAVSKTLHMPVMQGETEEEKMKIKNGVLVEVDKNIKSCEIPDSVTTIGEHAFYECKSLTSVVIPDGVTTIGNRAFSWCESLTSVVIPDGVTTIGNGAFYECKSLTSVVIPDSVTTIGNYAFSGCESLTSVKYKGTDHKVKCVDGYCMEFIHSRKHLNNTIYKATLFNQKNILYVAEQNGVYAHGKTAREAIQDLEFKLCKERGIEQYAGYTLDSEVDYKFYRIMTGACQFGVNEFVNRKGIDLKDSFPIREVIEMTRGEYGHETLMNNLRKLEIIT